MKNNFTKSDSVPLWRITSLQTMQVSIFSRSKPYVLHTQQRFALYDTNNKNSVQTIFIYGVVYVLIDRKKINNILG